MQGKYKWTERDIIRIAALADVSICSVRKAAAGGVVSGRAGVRIAEAVIALAPKEVGA